MAKIINFPKDKMKTPPQSKKELDQELLNNKIAYVDDVASHYGSSVFNKLAMHGFNVDEDNFIKDYAYVIEALKSCLLNNVGVNHPIQKTVIQDVKNFYGEDISGEYLTEKEQQQLDEEIEEDNLL